MPKATVRANARTVPKTNRDAAVGGAATGLPEEPMTVEQLAALDFEAGEVRLLCAASAASLRPPVTKETRS